MRRLINGGESYSLYVFVYSALGFASGRLTARYGPRRVLTIGGCLLGGGVMLTGSAHLLWHLYIALGLIAACGMSAAYVPCNANSHGRLSKWPN